ncbi:hypothetical protein GGF46_005077 [Coemansia sp. RSA 552]|nr:hypothetical protein GGF46_005077 [Coemansia sp. RSA 552]
MLNMFLGFEQANRYALLDPSGNPAGFMVEEQTMGSVLGRQVFRLHRPFRILVLDVNGNVCLRISRGFSVINSMVSVVSEPTRDLVGESQQEWHLWRRRYNLFSAGRGGGGLDQFARIDAPWLSWDFPMVDEQGAAVAGVFRDFSGIGMELFSDYGLYAVCFDGLALSQRFAATGRQAGGNVLSNMQMDLDRRAVALANAVSIDFDYFSRHSRVGHGGTPWMFFPMSSGLSQEQHDGDMD